MGNKYCCNCKNNDKDQEKLENNIIEENGQNTENIEELNKDTLKSLNTNLKQFSQNRIEQKILNVTSFFGFCEERLFNENEIKQIIKIQRNYLGFIYRKKYPNIKNSQIQYTNNLIKDLTEQYTKNNNVKRAETFIGHKFDKNSWKNYYNNELEDTIQKLFNYDYGKTLYQKILIENDSFYQGEVNLKTQKNGNGILLKSNGSKYEGSFRLNFFTGWGRFIDEEGTIYEGYFINNKLTGKGLKKSLNGNIYIGDFIGNKKDNFC